MECSEEMASGMVKVIAWGWCPGSGGNVIIGKIRLRWLSELITSRSLLLENIFTYYFVTSVLVNESTIIAFFWLIISLVL